MKSLLTLVASCCLVVGIAGCESTQDSASPGAVGADACCPSECDTPCDTPCEAAPGAVSEADCATECSGTTSCSSEAAPAALSTPDCSGGSAADCGACPSSKK